MSGDGAPWRKQSAHISGGGAVSPSPGPPPGPPRPPPAPFSPGAIPSVRIPTEISGRKEPPAAIQNAMMTKDKKPFTYTPGGLDLAEIRSPRMAKRLSRNAHLEDSCTGATAAAPPPQVQPHQLPPQTVAAMQPQIAVAVLPQGTALPKPQGSPGTHGHPQSVQQNGPPPVRPNNGVPPPPPPMLSGVFPPPPMLSGEGFPPPPPPMASGGGFPSPPMASGGGFPSPPMSSGGGFPSPPITSGGSPPVPSGGGFPSPPMPSGGGPPPPPPPMPSAGGPPPPPPLPALGAAMQLPSQIPPVGASTSDTMKRNQSRPDYIADIANHAHTLKKVNRPPRSQAEIPAQNFPPVQLRQTGLHHRMKSSDESEMDETDRNEVVPAKSPSPPRTFPNGVTAKDNSADRPQSSPYKQQVASPKFTPPQPSPTIKPVSSPPVNNRPDFNVPTQSQTAPKQPSNGEQKPKMSSPRSSPPRGIVMSFQFHPMDPPNPTFSQQQVFSPQPAENQTRISPPREIVTVFQPQVYQDQGIPQHTEKYHGKNRPPGLKMPTVSEQSPRPTPPSSASLRQAPAPWMSAPRQTKETPPWARDDAKVTSPPASSFQPNTRIVTLQMETGQQESNQTINSQQSRVRIIPIRLEGSNDVVHPQQQNNKYSQDNGNQCYSPSPAQQMTPQPQAAVHQVPSTPQTPRGWSSVSSPPVQSRSFRVLQKITGSDQEAFGENAKSDSDVVFLVNRVSKKESPGYSEMMSPPVYTMPSYPPSFYNMTSPTFNSNGHPGESEY